MKIIKIIGRAILKADKKTNEKAPVNNK